MKIERAEKQEKSEEKDFRGHHRAIRSAIERLKRPYIGETERQTCGGQNGNAQQSELRKPGAQLAREVRTRCPPYGDEQIGQPAEPRGGSPLMQGGESNQRQAIFQASHRVAGDDRGSDDGGCGKKQIGVAIRMPGAGKGENRERRQDAEHASQDKACAAHLSEADARGLHQDKGVRQNVSDLHRRERKRRAPNPTQAHRFQCIRFDVGAAQHENQKNNSADYERLKRQRRAAKQDREEPKDLKQPGHVRRSGPRDAKRDFAPGNVPIGSENLPAEAVLAGR